jgi:hypothetical protein
MELLYKILTHDAKSQYASMNWTPYLPKYKWNKDFTRGEWKPGKWLKVKGDLLMCSNGIHLTCYPLRWKLKHGRIFLTEYRGEYLPDNTDKVCFREVRLLCELGIDSVSLEVKIWKLIMSRANLSRADLSRADLYGANLSRANLSGANLSRADLYRADLSRADLSGANLYRADLSGADLSGANLSRADLSGADLSGANLSRANLSRADLYGCYISEDPKITGYKFDNGRLWKT